MVKTADPTGSAEVVGMRVVAIVGVGMIAKGVRFRVADPEVMTVVKRVAVAAVRRVIVTVRTVKMAKLAERVIHGMRVVAVVPDGAVIAMRLWRAREDRDPE